MQNFETEYEIASGQQINEQSVTSITLVQIQEKMLPQGAEIWKYIGYW